MAEERHCDVALILLVNNQSEDSNEELMTVQHLEWMHFQEFPCY